MNYSLEFWSNLWDYTGFGRLMVFRDKVTIRCIFIDKYLEGVRSAVALTLIFGLEVWR